MRLLLYDHSGLSFEILKFYDLCNLFCRTVIILIGFSIDWRAIWRRKKEKKYGKFMQKKKKTNKQTEQTRQTQRYITIYLVFEIATRESLGTYV